MSQKVYLRSDACADERMLAIMEELPEAQTLWPWLLTALDD